MATAMVTPGPTATPGNGGGPATVATATPGVAAASPATGAATAVAMATGWPMAGAITAPCDEEEEGLTERGE